MDENEFVDKVVAEYKSRFIKPESADPYSGILTLIVKTAARTYQICNEISKEH